MRSLLPALMKAGELTLFSANRPSLNEIFLTAVARHRQERQERDERQEVQS